MSRQQLPRKGGPPRRRVWSRSRPRTAWALALVALAVVALTVALTRGTGDGERRLVPGGGISDERFDPLAFRESLAPAFERRAAAGLSHVLYTKSPGGVVASARRTVEWRPQIETVALRYRLDPALLEAIVFVESAGRPDVIAGDDPEAAAGLTQILAETAVNLLGLQVDLPASRRLTDKVHEAEDGGESAEATRLRAQRRRIDERFEPAKALAATGRYLTIARKRFGRDDLAVASYHMGIGNLEDVLRLYAEESEDPIKEVVEREQLSYARLYFDSTPLLHASAYRKLLSFGDDSAAYLWRVVASQRILRLYREAPARLASLESLHRGRPSAEEVLHPRARAEVFEGPGELRRFRSAGSLVPLPSANARAPSIQFDSRIGSAASRLGQQSALYRALRPEAVALLTYLGLGVRAISGEQPLIVQNAVQDTAYQRLLSSSSREAARSYSLHTTGYSFDVQRTYRSPAQAQAFQFWLDRLQALNLIAWWRDPAVIHVTVSNDRLLVPVLLGRRSEGNETSYGQ